MKRIRNIRSGTKPGIMCWFFYIISIVLFIDNNNLEAILSPFIYMCKAKARPPSRKGHSTSSLSESALL